jgi:hypothetical protein
MRKGSARTTHAAVIAGSAVIHRCEGYNALLVHHVISGAAIGGYVSLKMGPAADGPFVAHHGEGTNIKAADVAVSYTALFKGIMDHVEITLARTDGTHTVTVQALNL